MRVEDITSRLERIEKILQSKILPEFLTISETSELLRCSDSKVRALLKSGELPFSRLGSSLKSNVLIKRIDVLELVG